MELSKEAHVATTTSVGEGAIDRSSTIEDLIDEVSRMLYLLGRIQLFLEWCRGYRPDRQSQRDPQEKRICLVN